MTKTLLLLTCALVPLSGQAVTLTEDFEAPFPAWETGWLGLNSNLQSYYGPGAGRGNNPDGLWVSDGASPNSLAEIIFDPGFGASLTSLAIDIAGYSPVKFQVYDISNNIILDVDVVLTSGALTDPGVYSHYSVSSANGISKMVFLDTSGFGAVEGNTSIDNVVVSTSTAVPDAGSTAALFSLGVAALSLARRKV